jgi:hypothetical protein
VISLSVKTLLRHAGCDVEFEAFVFGYSIRGFFEVQTDGGGLNAG